jgi:hypothetical protein
MPFAYWNSRSLTITRWRSHVITHAVNGPDFTTSRDVTAPWFPYGRRWVTKPSCHVARPGDRGGEDRR